jgi:hypothetical protein
MRGVIEVSLPQHQPNVARHCLRQVLAEYPAKLPVDQIKLPVEPGGLLVFERSSNMFDARVDLDQRLDELKPGQEIWKRN